MKDAGDTHAQRESKEESRDSNSKPSHDFIPATLDLLRKSVSSKISTAKLQASVFGQSDFRKRSITRGYVFNVPCVT
jgi:hypothetical protein